MNQQLVLEDWKNKEIITELTIEDMLLLNEELATIISCADGRQDYCCHLRKNCVAPVEYDTIRFYGGVAIFAESYKGFDRERALRERHEIIEGMIMRGIKLLKEMWHGPCGKLNSLGHTIDDLLLLAQEAYAFLKEGMPSDVIVTSHLHVRKAQQGGGQLQRTYNFNPGQT